jgi:hypothetical protein
MRALSRTFKKKPVRDTRDRSNVAAGLAGNMFDPGLKSRVHLTFDLERRRCKTFLEQSAVGKLPQDAHHVVSSICNVSHEIYAALCYLVEDLCQFRAIE